VSYPFGHQASEDDEVPPVCPYCGSYHWYWQPCDEEGPAWVEGDEPEEPPHQVVPILPIDGPGWTVEQLTPGDN